MLKKVSLLLRLLPALLTMLLPLQAMLIVPLLRPCPLKSSLSESMKVLERALLLLLLLLARVSDLSLLLMLLLMLLLLMLLLFLFSFLLLFLLLLSTFAHLQLQIPLVLFSLALHNLRIQQCFENCFPRKHKHRLNCHSLSNCWRNHILCRPALTGADSFQHLWKRNNRSKTFTFSFLKKSRHQPQQLTHSKDCLATSSCAMVHPDELETILQS